MAEIKMKARGQLTWKDQIRNAIDTTMSDARIIDFKSFKDKLMEKAVNVYERAKSLRMSSLVLNTSLGDQNLAMITKKETIINELDRRYERQYEQEEKLIALGLMDVENELRKNNKLVADLKKEQRGNTRIRTTNCRENSIRNAEPKKSKGKGYGGPSL